MTCLNDWDYVRDMLKSSRKDGITRLHKFIFEAEGDRRNRRRLREFTGFEFDENSDNYLRKSNYVDKELSIVDLISICNILGLNGENEDVKLHIFRNLSAGQLLKDASNDTEEENDEDNDEDYISVSQRSEITRASACNDEINNVHITTAKTQDLSGNVECGKVEAHQAESANYPKFSLNYHDVESSVKPFDGSSFTPVESWVSQFEETAAILNWNPLLMYVFGKKSLQGLAKSFVLGSKGLTMWAKLKDALLKEFRTRVDSQQVHRTLEARTMKKDESVMEYLYKMQEIASGTNMDDVDIIPYVIDGIRDLNINKQMLYGARTLEDFKEKIRSYEAYTASQINYNTKRCNEQRVINKVVPFIKSKTSNGNSNNNRGNYNQNNSNIPSSNRNNRCFNCGMNGHISANCMNRSKGTKCFRCNKFGHVAMDCKEGGTGDKREEVRSLRAIKDVMLKQVTIKSAEITALIDTGSMVNLMKLQVALNLNLEKTVAADVILTGFGNEGGGTRPIASVNVDTIIDGEIYNLSFHVIHDRFMKMDAAHC